MWLAFYPNLIGAHVISELHHTRLHSHFQTVGATFLKPGEKMSTTKDEETTATQNATGVTSETLKDKLEKELEATHVEIQDLSGSSVTPHCESIR